MTLNEADLSTVIVRIALESGADLAGLVDIESLKRAPSHQIYSKLPPYEISEVPNDSTEPQEKTTEGEVQWPKGALSMLIIAITHPEDTPALDYWRTPSSGGTEGNLQLIRINNKVIKWLDEHKGIKGEQVPYSVEQGGICIKDAGVLAGLGVIGKNNLFLTPQFGPRVRLRALALPVKLPSTGPMDFDPCTPCNMPCRKVCPQGAFDKTVFSATDYDQVDLPARDGVYARATCKQEMSKNRDNADSFPMEGKDRTMRVVTYCRACEFACPVGKKS